jgi:hypothetical protein
MRPGKRFAALVGLMNIITPIASSETYTIEVSDDAEFNYYWNGPVTWTNNGGRAEMSASYYEQRNIWNNVIAISENRPMLKFDLSSIPDDAIIVSVSLNTVAYWQSTDPHIYRTEDTWNSVDPITGWPTALGKVATRQNLYAGYDLPGVNASWLSMNLDLWTGGMQAADLADNTLSLMLVARDPSEPNYYYDGSYFGLDYESPPGSNYRPFLQIETIDPPDPKPTVTYNPGGAVPSDGSCTLSFPVQAGWSYRVMYSDDLVDWNPAGDWVPVTEDAPDHQWTDDGTATGTSPGVASRRFYKVEVSRS